MTRNDVNIAYIAFLERRHQYKIYSNTVYVLCWPSSYWVESCWAFVLKEYLVTDA